MSATPRSTRFPLERVAFWSACGSAVVILFSIAASQILLGLAIVALLASRAPIRLPAIAIPLGAFLLLTLISMLASGDPRAGMPQVKKLYVYLLLPVLFSVLKTARDAKNLMIAWCALAGISSALGIFQFFSKLTEARASGLDFYDFYMGRRITGFMGHWMTFSGQEMLVLVVLVAFLLFAPPKKWWLWLLWLFAAGMIGAALILSDTRSAWIAAFLAIVYLAGARKRILVGAVLIASFLLSMFAPDSIRERVRSITNPQAADSNGFRVIVWRTGLNIIRAHPLLGLGPEEVHKHFDDWVPADIPKPLPAGYYGHLHSIYIHYAAERGVPAALAIVWMLAMIIVDCARALRRAAGPRDRFILHAGIAGVIAIAVEGFFELNLGDSEVLTMFLALAACAYVAVRETRGAARAA